MVNLKEVTMEYGDRILFDKVTISFANNNNYGIVGANGSGKSTLLKIISGDIKPTKGEVYIPSTKSLSFLRQNQFEFENHDILDVVLMGNEKLWNISQKKKQLEIKPVLTDKEGHDLAELEIELSKLGGYTAEASASIILTGLGFPIEQHRNKMSTLSGGYKLRVLLAQCLYASPDVLLLDEPNNHLDINSISWLGNYLKEYNGVVVLVSHDHHFINRVSDYIVDIDYETLKTYKGDYEFFLRSKQLEVERKEKEIEKQEKKKEEMQKFVDRFKAKATKARQANSRKKQIEKMEDIRIAKTSRRAPYFHFHEAKSSGSQVLEVEGIHKSFGEKKVLNNINLKINRGDRIAIVGPNGIGKTTLLKIIMNELSIDAGEFKWGENIRFGYFAQNHKEQIPENDTVMTWLQGNFTGENVGVVRQSLGRMLFNDDDVKKLTGSLSGGETARLIFAKLTMIETNVLILDEPTNHLDLESIEALAKTLQNYSGTIIFVSHDRYFVDKIADVIFEITPVGYNRFLGTYSEFLDKQGEDYLDRDAEVRIKKSNNTKNVSKSEKKELVQERRVLNKELAKLQNREKKTEIEVLEYEKALEEINKTLNSSEIYQNGNAKKLEELVQKKKETDNLYEEAMEKWDSDQTQIIVVSDKLIEIDEKLSEV